jgi:thioesterase domain-containing protein
VPLHAQGSRPPVYLMHSHGGNTLEYHTLTNLLGPEQPVYALQEQGLNGRIAHCCSRNGSGGSPAS